MTDRRERQRSSDDESHLVRPRWVWAGTTIAVIGGIVLGIGLFNIDSLALTVGIPGAVLLVVGVVIGLWGGMLNDVHSGSPEEELQQVLHGDVHEGTKAGEEIDDRQARETAGELADKTRDRLVASDLAPHPGMAPGAGLIVLVVTIALVAAQWTVYPTGQVPQSNANRDLILTILAALAALRIVMAQVGRHTPSCVVIVLCGIGLILGAIFATHHIVAVTVLEATTGGVVLLCGLVCLLSPKLRLDEHAG